MGDGEDLIREVWGRWNSGAREFDPEILDPEVEIRDGRILRLTNTLGADE